MIFDGVDVIEVSPGVGLESAFDVLESLCDFWMLV